MSLYRVWGESAPAIWIPMSRPFDTLDEAVEWAAMANVETRIEPEDED